MANVVPHWSFTDDRYAATAGSFDNLDSVDGVVHSYRHRYGLVAGDPAYELFVVSRIREAVRRGMRTREAVTHGITSSAGVITSAAMVMVSVFVSFIFLHSLEVKQMGFGLAVAVILDAAIVRVLILPAVLTLLGRASWWPSRLATRDAGDNNVTNTNTSAEHVGHRQGAG